MPDLQETARVRLLDELAAHAMAPRTVETLGAWLLRADPDLPFRRTNAAIPFAGDPTGLEVDARIAAVEHFYRDRGLPPRFLIGPSSEPLDLDDRLDRRHYVVDAPVDVLTVDTVTALALLLPLDAPTARVHPEVEARWVARYADGPTRRRMDGYARLLAETALRHVVVTVDVDREPAAIGIGVLEREWVGVFGMATRPDLRRRGAARGVLRALARWAVDEGANNLYLQVETDNTAARTLYESVGFEHSHGYHYRVLA